MLFHVCNSGWYVYVHILYNYCNWLRYVHLQIQFSYCCHACCHVLNPGEGRSKWVFVISAITPMANLWCLSPNPSGPVGFTTWRKDQPCCGRYRTSWARKEIITWWRQIKYFLFSTLPGEMIQFDDHIFQMGWNHQLDKETLTFH